jgi:uncharacterized protein YacL (UPF0231 family)
MDIVIDDMNFKQVTQAMYENVKSNQHRLDEIEPVINKMAKQVDRLDQMIVGNGFARAVKDNTKELKAFRSEFQDFKLNREATCPVVKHSERIQENHERKRDWKVKIFQVSLAGIGGVSAVTLIVQRIVQIIGG